MQGVRLDNGYLDMSFPSPGESRLGSDRRGSKSDPLAWLDMTDRARRNVKVSNSDAVKI